MIEVTFYGDELFTVAASLEVCMNECERHREYKLADRFAELFKRVDDVIREDAKSSREALDKLEG